MSDLSSFLTKQANKTTLLSETAAFIQAVPSFFNAHVLRSPLDQTRVVESPEYTIFQQHGNKIRLDSTFTSVDEVESLCRALLKTGRSETVVVSDGSALHGFLSLACLEQTGTLVLDGQGRNFAEDFSEFFDPRETFESFTVLTNFHGQSAARESLRKYLLAISDTPQEEISGEFPEIPSPGCSSFREDFSLNLAELDERVKSKIYVKRRYPEISRIRSSPFVRKFEDTHVNFPETPHASLAPLDVLVNTMAVKTEVRYNKISGLKISGCVEDTSKFDFLYVEDISDCAKLSGLNQGGDVLVRLRSPWLLEFAEAAWVMRLALTFKTVSLVRSALDPGHSFVYAENFFKQRRMPLVPVIEQVALYPDFAEFARGFNFRVAVDAKRTAHVKPSLNALKALAGRGGFNFFVYFGSFDPVHENHAALVSALAAEAGAFVAVIPNRGDNENKREISDHIHRVSMLRLCFEGVPNVGIFETSETTEAWSAKERISRELGERLFENREEFFDLHLVLGEDSFAKATSWKKSGIFRLTCNLRVFPREGSNLEIPKELASRVVLVGNHKDPVPGLSSSKLRRTIADGKAVAAEWIDSRVLAYANQHQLYKTQDSDVLFPDSD